jgi:excisionase family DNA binding protein
VDKKQEVSAGTLSESAAQNGGSILDARWEGRSTFTVEEAGCQILGLSKCSAYAAASAGRLPTIRIGRRLVVPRHAFEKLLASA